MLNLNLKEIAKFDSDGMLQLILNFPQQLRHANEIAKSTDIVLAKERIQNICVIGMGGSAIGGDIARAYLSSQLKVPFWVSRNYSLPNFIDEGCLAIVCSYSGNTEETLSAYDDACRRGAQIVCITTGGALAEKAKTNGHQIYSIPEGYPPRSALGYLTIAVLQGIYAAGLSQNPAADILETVSLLAELQNEFHPEVENNLAKRIARTLQNKIPLIYSSASIEAVTLRWKGQLSENGKAFAFANVFPEMNHNEIVGWGPLADINAKFQAIYLQDRDDHPQVKKRMEVTKKVIEKQSAQVFEVESRGQSFLARLFSLIYLGDMVSLYLAILHKVDPTPVENIHYLKTELSRYSEE